MKTKLVGILVCLFFLTSCGQIVGAAIGGPSIDFNADVEAIKVGVRKFEQNSSQSVNIKTFEEYKSIVENNGAILDEIDSATNNFLNNINRASSKLPTEDTKESPSIAKLTAWAEGYKSWIYYQELNQRIGEECLNYSSDWMVCLITNLSKTLENEDASAVRLTSAIQGIEEWVQLANQ
jgi:hypothetical protein